MISMSTIDKRAVMVFGIAEDMVDAVETLDELEEGTEVRMKNRRENSVFGSNGKKNAIKLWGKLKKKMKMSE